MHVEGSNKKLIVSEVLEHLAGYCPKSSSASHCARAQIVAFGTLYPISHKQACP